MRSMRVKTIAALAVVSAVSLAGAIQQAAAEIVPCTGPLAQCFASEWQDHGVVCRGGSTGMDLERCIGEVHEKHSKANPYKTGSAPKPAAKQQ